MYNKNIISHILVLFIVLIIWFNQNLFRTHRTETPLLIRFANMPEDYVVTHLEPSEIFLTIEGRGIDILRFKRTNYFLNIDLNQLRIGTNDLNVTEHNLHLEEPQHRAHLKFFLNYNLTIEIDRSVAANVPVVLRYMTMDDELFFNRRNAHTEPQRVEIVGPGSVVAGIPSVTTVPLSSDDVVDDDHVNAELEIPDGVLGIKPDVVKIVLESPAILTRTIPLIRVNYPADRLAMIIPQTVTVKVEGLAEDVQRLRPAMINAYVTIPEGYGLDFATIEVRLPENLTLIEHTPQRVQIFYHE